MTLLLVPSASSGMRTSGLLSARPTAGSGQGAKGWEFYATDTDTLFLSDGTGWIIMREPRVTTWTPTFGGITVASSTRSGWYERSGGKCRFLAQFIMGGTPSVFNSNPTLTLPFAAGAVGLLRGGVFDSGTAWRFAVTNFPSGPDTVATLTLVNFASTWGDQAVFSTSVPQTWANLDNLFVEGDYPMSSIYS